MVKTNQSGQYIRNDDGVLPVSNEKLFNKIFAWDRNSLPQADTVSSVPYLIDKAMIRSRRMEWLQDHWALCSKL